MMITFFKTPAVFKLSLALIISFLFSFYPVFANDQLTISIKADHENWIYKPGEKPRFTVTVLDHGKKPEIVKVKYQVGPEKMPFLKSDSLLLTKKNDFLLSGFTMHEPGFLRYTITAEVGGKTVKSTATAAFSPELIKPTVQMPADFKVFWQQAIKNLSDIPLDPRVELIKAYSTEKVNVYEVSFQNINSSRIYGILSVPKKEGKYPAVLKVPGAGVRAYGGDVALAEQGLITLEIGIHGIPVTLANEVYKNLGAGGLYQYSSVNLDNKDQYYYKRVYLGCVRALDFLVSQSGYDGKNLAVYGGSQGGALAIVTAALDNRVKFLGAYYPALSDITGYLNNRAGGWPHLLTNDKLAINNKKEKLETITYYDVVNFARQLTVPGFYSWGFNDEVCPPTSMYAAYNSIAAPKELLIYKETGHHTVPEQTQKMNTWLVTKLKE